MQMHEEEQQKNEEFIEKNKHKIMKPAIDLMNAYQVLGQIIGETVEEDLVNKIFKEFCMGK
mgnify:CR=1 FL=1